MHTVEDYLAKVRIDKILYINKIPLDKVVPKKVEILNPHTMKYRNYWQDEIRKCIDGFWVEHNGEHKYVPGVLYFYGTHWHILLNEKNAKSKTKKILRPLVRDLEWIKTYLYIEARGFSGFEDDDEYTCHREVGKPEEERTPEFLTPGCYDKKGKLKKYVPAREYLWKYHKKALGKAMFENDAQNVVDLESRGCLAKDTMVRMFDGSTKAAQNIIVGDKLMGKNSTPRTVQWLHSGIEDMFDVSSNRFDTIRVNKNHTLSVEYKYKPKKLGKYVNEQRSYPIQELYEKQAQSSFRDRFRRYMPGEIDYRENSSEFNPYMIGYWLADGRSNTVSIKSTDVEVLDNIDLGTRVVDTIKPAKEGWKTSYELKWLKRDNEEICENFKDMLYNKHIPQRYKTASKSQRFELLAGLIDGDGCLDTKCNSFDIYCGPVERIADDIVDVARSLGIYANKTTRRRGNYKNTFEVLLSGDIHKIPTKYARKQAKKLDRRIKVTNDSFKITPAGREEFFGFHVDGDNEYLLADYTVDHNTGKSYTMSGLCGHNFLLDGAQDFIEFWDKRGSDDCLSSETLVGAIDSKYSDDLIKKIKLGLESLKGEYTIGKKTYPAPLSKSFSGPWTAGKTVIQEVEVKVGGQWKKIGSRSKFQHRSFMDNPFAANGTRASFNVIDEVGFMGNLQASLVQMKECTANGAEKFGTIWMTGTGGDMDGGATESVMAVFYDPETNDCVSFDDYYEGTNQRMGFFVPAWMGLNQFKDDLGNTNYKGAIQYLLNVRNKLSKGKDKRAYNGELCQRPLIPSEVFLISGGNILPVGKLKEQHDFLESTTDPEWQGVIGTMSMDPTGKVEFKPDVKNELRECGWPVKKDDDHTGGVVIFEQPHENPGFGYYLAGNDPYDQDKAPNSVSLGSLLIMKRQGVGVSAHDIIVAEYTARPETAKDFYEQCRLLLMYFHCIGTCLYENEKIGIKTYLENNNALHYLAPTPSIMKSNVTSNVNRGFGQHMSTTVKEECEIFMRDWLIAPAGDGKLNLHYIKSKPLLKELINYNKIGNFDRVIALMLCIVQLTQMHKIIVEDIKEEAEEDPFFERSMFGGTFDIDTFSDMLGGNDFIGSNFN